MKGDAYSQFKKMVDTEENSGIIHDTRGMEQAVQQHKGQDHVFRKQQEYCGYHCLERGK